jgi:hypothetical protein
VLTIGPELVPALVERGLIEAETGDTAAALADIRKAVRLQSTVADEPAVRRVLELSDY